jgi:hypothetical protein
VLLVAGVSKCLTHLALLFNRQRDQAWIDKAEKTFELKNTALEKEKSNAMALQNREQMRVSGPTKLAAGGAVITATVYYACPVQKVFLDQGALHLERGNVTMAIRTLMSVREYCGNSKQLADVNLHIAEVAALHRQYGESTWPVALALSGRVSI